MNILLARPKAEENECALGYLIRLSEMNGFRHVGHLLKFAGLEWKNNRVPVHGILTGEYDLSRYLLRLGVESLPMKAGSFYKLFRRAIDTPYVYVKHPKICPECIAGSKYCNYIWAFLPVVACSKHRLLLVDEFEKSDVRLSWYRGRVDGVQESLGPFKISRLRANSPILSFNSYIESLFSDCKFNVSVPAIMNELSFNEALTCINFLAHYSARLSKRDFFPCQLKNKALAKSYVDVWSVLSNWPDGLYDLLSKFIDNPMSNRGVTGLNKHFRDLYDQLYRRRKNPGIFLIKDEFDRYIMKCWPGVLDANRLKRITLPANVNNLISKKEAANIVGCGPERINKLVELKQLSRIGFKGKSHYLRDEAESLSLLRRSNWSMDEACSFLNISRFQLKQLLDARIILAVNKPGPLNRDWLIDRKECEKFIARLINNSRLESAPDVSISLAGVEHQGFSIVDVVSLMLGGNMNYNYTPDLSNPLSIKQFGGFSFI